LTHLYGRDGRDSKKIDTKSIGIDFQVFTNMAGENFLSYINSSMDNFVKKLNTTNTTGITNILKRENKNN
jgi:hypothetical protein